MLRSHEGEPLGPLNLAWSDSHRAQLALTDVSSGLWAGEINSRDRLSKMIVKGGTAGAKTLALERWTVGHSSQARQGPQKKKKRGRRRMGRSGRFGGLLE